MSYFSLDILQVVKDLIEDVCNRLDIFDPVEMEEYTLFLRTSKSSFIC